jgi:hypothetical protein
VKKAHARARKLIPYPPGRTDPPLEAVVEIVISAAAEVELLSGPTEAGTMAHDPGRVGKAEQVRAMVPLYAVPTGATLRL